MKLAEESLFNLSLALSIVFKAQGGKVSRRNFVDTILALCYGAPAVAPKNLILKLHSRER